jgi:DNA repair protein RAD50
MELTQKKTAQTFKQLDGVLRMMDPETGERVSLSHKCTELDKQIPQLLGVSKPILEHVVFCHQEDASWPLMEGAVLKKRFDDIFDSTKYSKALHIFRQTEKDFLVRVKDLKVDVASYSAHKQAADAFRKELTEQNEQIESLDDMKKELAEQISRMGTEMKSLREILTSVDEIEDLIVARTKELDQQNEVTMKQREMLEEDLTQKHTSQELQNRLRNFYQNMTSQVQEKQDLENQVNDLQNDIDVARQEEMKLTSQIGKLTAEKEVYEKNLLERYKKMESIAQMYSLDLTQLSLSQGNASFVSAFRSQTQGDGDDDNEATTLSTVISLSSEDMERFFQTLEAKKMELAASLNEHKLQYRSEEDNVTVYLTDVGGKLQAIENGR